MKLALISLEGKSSKKIANECKNYFSDVKSFNLKDFQVCINNQGIEISPLKKVLSKYDCIYIRGSYKYAQLQRSITRTLNHEAYMPIKPIAFTIGHDKFSTLLELQKSSVPIPQTHYAATKKQAKEILSDVEFPIIIKVQEGTQGKGVMIAESKKSALTILDMLEDFNKPYLIQEFIETEKTSDIRAIVSGKRVVASYKRVAQEGEIRSNIHAGGNRERYELTEEQKELALKSSEAIGADICGVDILNSNPPAIIEINLSPGIAEIDEVTGVNVAKKIAKTLYIRTKIFKKRKREKERKKIKKISKKS